MAEVESPRQPRNVNHDSCFSHRYQTTWRQSSWRPTSAASHLQLVPSTRQRAFAMASKTNWSGNQPTTLVQTGGGRDNKITIFAGRTERGLGHGGSEDHRNVEQTTPLLGYQHRRARTETVDDGVRCFLPRSNAHGSSRQKQGSNKIPEKQQGPKPK